MWINAHPYMHLLLKVDPKVIKQISKFHWPNPNFCSVFELLKVDNTMDQAMTREQAYYQPDIFLIVSETKNSSKILFLHKVKLGVFILMALLWRNILGEETAVIYFYS